MKINGSLLALSVFHPNVWGTAAFVVPGPQGTDRLSPSFSYRENYMYDQTMIQDRSMAGDRVAEPVSRNRNTAVFDRAPSDFRPENTYPSGPVEARTAPRTMARAPRNSNTAVLDRSPASPSTFQPENTYPSAPIERTTASGRMTRSTNAMNAMRVEKVLGRDAWETLNPVVKIEGSSLRTWSFTTSAIDRVGVFLRSEGRPINSNIELWQGPDNTPEKMSLYSEDGNTRPFSAVIETPRGHNTIAIRNSASMELPIEASVQAEVENDRGGPRYDDVMRTLNEMGTHRVVQGGAIHTFPFAPTVASVQVLFKTDGRPLNARVELLQGPNNQKQVIDIYTENGLSRPFFAVIETPGSGNVVRIMNTANLEYPMTASVEPYQIEPGYDESGIPNDSSGLFIID